jgi:membrane-associated phospholipid phosphatase
MTDYLLRLRMGYPMKAEMAHAAIMSFPSEHVLVAVLGVEALSVIRSIRRPVQVAGTLICLSTVTTGWHYGIDVLGGLAVAWIASRLAKITCDRLLEMDAAKS